MASDRLSHVTICSVVSKDGFGDAQFVGGDRKPMVVAPLRPCNNTGNYGRDHRRSIYALAITPASHKTRNSGRLYWPILVFGHDSAENPPKFLRNVRWIDGPRTDDSSPTFDRFGQQIGYESAIRQSDQRVQKLPLLLVSETG